MPQFDSPWKEALDRYFESFLEICFPELHQAIDWSVRATMLDKELQQIAPHGDVGPRTVDKLVEVRLLSGEVEWLLVHLEVQSQSEAAFAKRMYVYYYRISDKYDRPLVSLAVLGDGHPDWRPNRFEQSAFDCRVQFDFPTIKLLDFLDRVEELEQSTNPFATVILAHLMAMQTAGHSADQCEWKLRLLRPLYERGMSAEDVRSLFRVIDWMIELPRSAALTFDVELQKIEQEYKMPYVTSIERRAIEQGREQGLEQGREQGAVAGQIQLLERLLKLPETSLEELLQKPLADLAQLRDKLQSEFTSRANLGSS